ncbi:MAG: nucleotidyltransferase domain-containing protein [Anaerolineae bacterium]
MVGTSQGTVIQFARDLAARLGEIDGVIAVVLGGSWARGAGTPTSDIDLGIYYDSEHRPSLEALRALAAEIDDRHSSEIVTNYGDWGTWIDGGAWMEIGGRRVDWLYRNFQNISRFVEECRAGQTMMHYQPGHPHGFPTYLYMGEVFYCVPLYDPAGKLAELKAQTSPYPALLKQSLLNHNLWEAGFAIDTARKSAARGDVYYVSGALFRSSSCMIQALYALNETYWINEKGSLQKADSFEKSPIGFGARVSELLGEIGSDPATLESTLAAFEELVAEVRTLAK